MLTITPVLGDTITLTSKDISDPHLKSGFSRHVGLQTDNVVTFYFQRFLRARLPELEALAGLNVVQTVNRAGKIQLTSEKPCSFVRFRWDTARVKAWTKNNVHPIYSEAQQEGVFTVDAQLDGMMEALTLTLYRGDWLWQPDGTVERFT